MGLDLRQMRCVVVLAEEGHFGRAAARLFISQPALSKQVRLVEDRLGLTLFSRGPRGAELTADGQSLLSHARAVLEAADRFEEAARRLAREQAGTLRLAFVGQAANEATPVILRTFALCHPGVVVDLHQLATDRVAGALRSGEVDVAILRLPLDTTGLHVEALFSEPRVAVLPSDHPLAHESSIAIESLLGEPWVVSSTPDPEYQHYALATAARGGMAPLLGPTVRSIDEYLEAVLTHRGIGLAPESAGRFYSRPGIRYVPVVGAEPSVVALGWNLAAGAPSPLTRAFCLVAHEVVAHEVVDGVRGRPTLARQRDRISPRTPVIEQ